MRKILLCLCFVFAVGLLFSACGKDDNKQNPNTPAPTQEETTMPPIPEDKQMSNEEQEAINSSNPETPLPAGLTIFQLCFGSDSIETGTNAEYTVVNNANYSFVFGLKDGEGNIMYKTIDAANVTFDFVSDNDAVSKTNKGFSTSSQFYSDRNANIKVTINFKNLILQEFCFVLKSNKDKPDTPTPDPTPNPLVPAPELPAQIINGKQLALNMQFGYTKAGRVIQSNQTIEIKRGVGFILGEYITIDRNPYDFNKTDTTFYPTGDMGLPNYRGHGQEKFLWNNEVVDRARIMQYCEIVGDDLVKFKDSVPVGSEVKYEFTIIDFGDSIDNLTPVNMSAYIIMKVIE